MLASAPILASQTTLLRNMNTWEACRNRFPENKILLESSAPCPLPLCTVSMRKLSVEVRPKERNSSHYFQHYQLQSTPILPYQVTLSAILSPSFPHIQHCDTHPVLSSPFNSVSTQIQSIKTPVIPEPQIKCKFKVARENKNNLRETLRLYMYSISKELQHHLQVKFIYFSCLFWDR